MHWELIGAMGWPTGGGWRKKDKMIIVTTNIFASGPPKRRPTARQTARAKMVGPK